MDHPKEMPIQRFGPELENRIMMIAKNSKPGKLSKPIVITICGDDWNLTDIESVSLVVNRKTLEIIGALTRDLTSGVSERAIIELDLRRQCRKGRIIFA